MYKALDISKYILVYYRDKGVYITNLKLQKLLYYIQLECLSKLNKLCFCERIEAWKHGPVVPDVYFEYNSYLSQPLFFINKDVIEIDKDYKECIDSVLDDYKDMGAWDMVKKTHSEKPWQDSYQENKSNVISVEVMKNYVNTKKE